MGPGSQHTQMSTPDDMMTAPPPSAQYKRWLLLIVVGCAVALHAPSLLIGFVGDDYTHQFILQGKWDHPNMRPWNLYDFGTYPLDTHSAWWNEGALPWWTDSDWKLRFFRPLASLTIWLDHTVYGDWVPGYKLTSLFWYAALLLVIYGLYRAFELSQGTALLAVALFAVAECSLMPVGWVANRNSLIAVLFMAASVLAVSRRRTWGYVPALVAALALAALACLAKEGGIAAFAMIVLYLVWARRGSQPPITGTQATAGAVTAGVLAGCYIVFLAASGYGARSLYYPTPWGDTAEYLTRVGALLPAGVCHLLGPFGLRTLLDRPFIALPVVVVLGWILWRELKAVPAARFFAAWIVLAILPQAAGQPAQRMLFGAAVGSSALLALLVVSFLSRPRQETRYDAYRVLAIVILGYAGGLPAWKLMEGWADYARTAKQRRQIITAADVGSPDLGQREAFILQSPYTGAALVPIATWRVETDDAMVRFWPMQMERRALRWTRLDERTFELESLDGPFLTRSLEKLFLADRSPRPANAGWTTALFTVHTEGYDAQGLHSFRVHCPESLDHPSYRFLTFRERSFVALPPPAVGQSVTLERVTR